MNHLKLLSALTILSLLSTACSNMSFKKDEEKTAVVKRVAVVAFASTQPITSGEGIIGSLTGTRNSNQPFNPALCTEENHLLTMIKIVNHHLEKDLKLTAIPETELVSNPVYQTLQAKVKDMWSHGFIPKDNSCFVAKGVIDSYKWPQVTQEDIRALKIALKVDAVVMAIASSEQIAMRLVGVAVGGSKTKVTLLARMYNGIDEDPIYYDLSAAGKEVEDGTSDVLGFADRDEINKKTLIATDYAAATLTERFRMMKK